MKTLILLRGLPGAGKSTLAELIISKDYCHKEADMYFVDREGNYKFVPSQIKDAHEWCKDEVAHLMKYEHSPIVVSNTFTQEWEMENYYELAKQYGYTVHSVIVENRHEGVNIHNCPPETIDRMEARFEIKLK
jgi:predicted kinase